MTIALWIIAVCEIIRAAQNMIQIATIRHDTSARDNAYAEFVQRLLKEFDEQEGRQDG